MCLDDFVTAVLLSLHMLLCLIVATGEVGSSKTAADQEANSSRRRLQTGEVTGNTDCRLGVTDNMTAD